MGIGIAISNSIGNIGNMRGSFIPGLLPDLQLWLDASRSSTITKDGSDKVSQWDDLSGNKNHAIQGTGVNQPTFTDNHINNKSVINFDGGTEEMNLTSTLSLSDEFTGFFTANNDDTASTRTIFGHTAYSNKISVINPEKAFIRMIDGGSSDSTQNYLAQSVTGIQTIQRNSSDKVDMAFDSAAFTRLFSDIAQSGTADYNIVGSDGTFNWQGDIAEIIIYNRALSISERKQVEVYLSNKWGVAI